MLLSLACVVDRAAGPAGAAAAAVDVVVAKAVHHVRLYGIRYLAG